MCRVRVRQLLVARECRNAADRARWATGDIRINLASRERSLRVHLD